MLFIIANCATFYYSLTLALSSLKVEQSFLSYNKDLLCCKCKLEEVLQNSIIFPNSLNNSLTMSCILLQLLLFITLGTVLSNSFVVGTFSIYMLRVLILECMWFKVKVEMKSEKSILGLCMWYFSKLLWVHKSPTWNSFVYLLIRHLYSWVYRVFTAISPADDFSFCELRKNACSPTLK